ncbi:MAG: hypothetical protein LBH41_01610 [Rickettsiales bacterium]|nr:hypothetical protein [Rickettsiales bacterium]
MERIAAKRFLGNFRRIVASPSCRLAAGGWRAAEIGGLVLSKTGGFVFSDSTARVRG